MTLAPSALASSRLSPLELSSGMARGRDDSVVLPARRESGGTAHSTLHDAVRRALVTPPCVLSFSGGRDSSTLLAIAVDLARREGHDLPVPVSLRFPLAEDSEEGAWQEQVIRHLGLTEWVRLDFTDELDLVGPYAQRSLTINGLIWPFNSHFHLPVADLATNGSMITGFGGDELMATGWAWAHEMAVLAREVRPGPRDVVRLATAVGPRAVRREFLRRRMSHQGPPPRPWLTAEASRAVTELMLDDMLDESVHWGRSVVAWIAMRYRTLVVESLGRVAALSGAAAHHPLADVDFLLAIADQRGRHGFFDRTRAVEFLVGDLLPRPLINRSSKATFGDAFWNVHSRAFGAVWNGEGVDDSLVDVELLGRMWASADPPDGRTQALFQAAWLATHTG